MLGQPFYTDCGKCGGTGTYAPPPLTRGGGGWSQQLPGPCPDCNAIGALPSAEGRSILELVQRFSRDGRIEIP